MAEDEDSKLSRVFQSLSDPKRRKIVELLREAGESTINDVAEAFDISLNAVSKHLKNLEKAGIINRRIVGREHFVSIQWESLMQPYQWLHYYHHYWSRRLDALVDYAQMVDQKRTNQNE